MAGELKKSCIFAVDSLINIIFQQKGHLSHKESGVLKA